MKRSIITFCIAFYFSIQSAFGNDGLNLSAGVAVGTTGIGLDVSATPVSFMRVRAGVDYMPRFNVPINFGLDSYTDSKLGGDSEFEELRSLMKQLTGFDVDRNVKMNCKATMVNFKLLVDFFPIPGNKHWYATAGFFWGASRIGTAVNDISEMPSLLAVGLFNQMHDKILATDFIEEPIYGDFYLDPDVADKLQAKMKSTGRVGIHVGDYPDGKPYMMEPDEDGMVKADMFVNCFKPYLGLGYTTSLDHRKRFNFGVDCGVLFWGGRPGVVTHDNVNLVEDVVNVRGKVGDYVDIVKALKVYPMLNLRVAYRFGK